MKFIILVSNLKEISPSVFSWKKEYIKNYDAILLLKYDSAKKILNYAYMLENGVGRYNIFFKFLHKACWILLFVSFSYRIIPVNLWELLGGRSPPTNSSKGEILCVAFKCTKLYLVVAYMW